MNQNYQPIIAVVGPTAIGKTELSLNIAEQFCGEIIGVDSMQIYRYMDIGTAKPTRAERSRIAHHLIDVVDPDEKYSVGRYVKDAEYSINKIRQNSNIPILVGGTGLYLRSLLQGLFEIEADSPNIRSILKEKSQSEAGRNKLYEELCRVDPESAKRIHQNDTQRLVRALEIYQTTGIPWTQHLHNKSMSAKFSNVIKIGLTCDRESLYQRINKRVQVMIAQGLKEEVQMLLKMGFHEELNSMQAIGYRHMIAHLSGKWDIEKTKEMLARDTRHYAKRQYTWFKNDSEIEWFQVDEHDKILQRISLFLTNKTEN
jgi:tRNA dimethylallyltransferase